ncbi:lytic transglycosylase domain-containing protein [Nocardia sp. CNY236]|uniref:lytic transglycosylase domain-containing protein n=1 Tax=Nocardia sp. CNY236 TaxID=1169152 RepID=UPI0004038C93|nr:lytic murein transglycosylase [Nocardia sp. CNY236]
MGRHRKKQPATARRSSVIALTGLFPAGLVTVAAASDVDDAAPTTVAIHVPEDDPAARDAGPAAELAAATDLATHAVDEPTAPKPEPEVKTIALPDGRQAAALPDGPLGIPGVADAAYRNAERILAEEDPACGMPWSLLAGIGRVESTHAFGGRADSDGNPLSPIHGPVLDGTLAGNQVVYDSDNGALDGLSSYDRAVGPMQFLPETWQHYAADGNDDGVADPQNLFDATLAAGKYLCDGGSNMRDLSQQSKAILRYNHSMAYVANVMAWEASYSAGISPRPADLPKI